MHSFALLLVHVSLLPKLIVKSVVKATSVFFYLHFVSAQNEVFICDARQFSLSK